MTKEHIYYLPNKEHHPLIYYLHGLKKAFIIGAFFGIGIIMLSTIIALHNGDPAPSQLVGYSDNSQPAPYSEAGHDKYLTMQEQSAGLGQIETPYYDESTMSKPYGDIPFPESSDSDVAMS